MNLSEFLRIARLMPSEREQIDRYYQAVERYTSTGEDHAKIAKAVTPAVAAHLSKEEAIQRREARRHAERRRQERNRVIVMACAIPVIIGLIVLDALTFTSATPVTPPASHQDCHVTLSRGTLSWADGDHVYSVHVPAGFRVCGKLMTFTPGK